MKRILIFATIAVLLVITVTASAENPKYGNYDTVNVTINGTPLSFNFETEIPAIKVLTSDGSDAKTMLPLRKVVESVNGIVNWDGSTQTASVIKPQVNITFTETKDGTSATGDPIHMIPIGTTYTYFLSWASLSNIPTGKYTIFSGIYKIDSTTGIAEQVDVKSPSEITVDSKGNPVPIMTSWAISKLKEKGAGKYAFMILMKDNEGTYYPIAVHSMDYTQ